MDRIEALLLSEGLTMADLVAVTIFITDPSDLMPVNDVYSRRVRNPVPGTIDSGRRHSRAPGALVEIEAVARR